MCLFIRLVQLNKRDNGDSKLSEAISNLIGNLIELKEKVDLLFEVKAQSVLQVYDEATTYGDYRILFCPYLDSMVYFSLKGITHNAAPTLIYEIEAMKDSNFIFRFYLNNIYDNKMNTKINLIARDVRSMWYELDRMHSRMLSL